MVARRTKFVEMALSGLNDTVIAGLFFALCAALSVAILGQIGTLFFYQNFAPEIIYAACGLGFYHPGTVPAALQNFLLVRESTFDCSLLDATAPLQPAGFFARLQLYLSYSIVLLWHPPTLTYRDLWPLVAIFGGAYGGGAYVLLRLFLPKFLSIVGGLLVTFSPVALTLVLSFRDYSKAPFFIWGLVFLVYAIRSDNVKRACLFALGAGIVAGLGFGFRTDLIVMVPAGIIALLVVARWRDLRFRIPAIVIFAAASLVVAWPAASLNASSSYGSVMMQGMSDPFQRFLGLGHSLYGLGARYSDELVLSSVAAAERPRTPDWDENEAQALYGTSQSIKRSGENAQRWMPLFIGDLATQGLKSLVWLTAMPALFAQNRPSDPSFGETLITDITAPGTLFFSLIAHPWLVALGISGSIVFCWREVALRPRYFLATILLFALLAATTAAQFAVRHVFHFEFLWILAALSPIAALRDHRKLRVTARPFAIGLGALVLFIGTIYAGTLFYQQNTLKAALSELLSLPREAIEFNGEKEAVTPASLVLDVPVPVQHAQIVEAPDDSMNDKIPLGGLQWDVRAEADRMILSFANCPEATYEIVLEYQGDPTVWQPMDETIPVRVIKPMGLMQVLFSAFYRPTQHLSKVSVTPYPACSVRLERIEGDSPLPFLLTAVLPSNWQDVQLFRGLGGFGATDW